MNKKRISILLCLALVITMIGSPDQSLMAKKKAPKLNKKKVTLYVGKSVRLKVKGTSKKAKWKSSSKKVATVSSKGVVKAKRKGKAKITAKVGKKKLVCRVTVKNKIGPVTVTEKPNDIEQQRIDGANTVAPTVSATEQSQPTADGNGQAGTETDKPQPTADGNGQAGTETDKPQPTADGNGQAGTETDKPQSTAGGNGQAGTQTASPKPTTGGDGPTICMTPPPGFGGGDDPTVSPKPTTGGKQTAAPATDIPQPTVVAGEVENPLPLVPAIGQASFDNGTDGFTAQGNASIQIANNGYEGKCLQISNRKTASDGVVYAAGEKVTAGESYTVQGYVKTASGAGTLKCMYRTGNGQNDIHELAAVSASGDGWTKFMGTLTVPAGFEKLDIWFELEGATGSTETFYLDEVNILQIISMKGTFDHIFWKTGTCIRPDQMRNPEIMAYVRKHYSSITLENDMKPDALMPGWLAPIDTKTARAKTGDYVIPDNYKEDKVPNLNYSTVDEMLRIAKQNGLKIRYHVLVWHAQSPEWFFKENYSQNENAAYVSEETMNVRMEMYIRSVIHHVYTVDGGAYRDVVYAWDVANEYFSNTPDKNWSAVYGNREGKWENHPAFIKRAFELAHGELERLSLADSVSLFYNDFNTYMTTDKIIDMIHYINSGKKVCSGVGMQSHIDVTFPSVDSYVNTVQRFIEEGFEVQITELDVACVDKEKPEAEQDIPALYETQARYVKELTEKLVDLQRSTGYKITGLTWWGMYDGMSWVEGSHALMFHNSLNEAKPSYFAFMDAAASTMNKPAPTPPPLLKYDFSDKDSYGIEDPGKVSHVLNQDGSITLTFRGGGAYDFFLPKSEWNGVDYKSIVLTYTSEGGNLNHALYDANAVGKENLGAGKHAEWDGRIKNTQGEEKKLILNVTNDCVGGCIRGLQIFTQRENVTITIKSMIFCGKTNPTKFDLDPSLNPPMKPTPVPTATPTAVPTVTPTPVVIVTVPPTPIPPATPKYTPPAETAPPVLNIDFTAEGAYHNESPEGADVVTNDDGSITITFKNQYAAFNFYLPDTAQNYYSKYTSVTLTYTSEGGNLGHALYDTEMQGTNKTDAGKHPDWDIKIPESGTQNTLTFDVTSECVGGCIRGFQIFNPHDLKEGKTITITVKSIVFNAEPEVEETEEPWTPLDVTGNMSGGVKTDDGVVLNNLQLVTIPLPNLGDIVNGFKVEVTVSGTLTEESTGFRIWLADGETTASDQYHYTKSNGVGISGQGDGDLAYKAGAFSITAVLTVGNNPNKDDPKTDTANKLLIKAPRYGESLNGVTITDIQVRNADNSPYKWVTTWGTAEEKCDTTKESMPKMPLEDTTIREIIRVTTGGEKLRLRLSNQYGKSDVEVKSLHLAKQIKADESTIDPSTDTAVTVNGSEEFVIPKEKVIVTDPVDFPVNALDNVAVSAYFGATPTNNITGHRGARATTYQVSGNHVSEETFTNAQTTLSWFFLADASIWSLKKSKAVVCFGDSITDGYGTDAGYLGRKPDSYTRWIDYFAKRLQANESTKHISLINEGIGSNSILGAYPTDAGKDRFARDLLEHDGVGYCIILFGVNDLNKLQNTSKYNELLPEYQKMVKLCHDNGIKVYGAPILPFGTSDYYSDASEEVRTMINKWMRSTDSQMDGIIDFESAVADPNDPKKILEKYTHEDGLHPYDGYDVMANAIDLSLFE